ncbi:DUF3224 domain-containing protein [Oleiharenicola lentus]|uniref:DUF3224 domain-containing protein n=1 Tax=Oleiharenicola lentus TaxID=2508720 RepID=UPI003F6778C7
MKSFVILFRQGPHPLTDADKAARQTAISTWAREQNAAGHKLEPRSIAPDATHPGITAPNETSGLWPVTALLFLEARDLAEATAVAAAHPAKDYNVSMEVRPWSPPAAPAVVVKQFTKISGAFDVNMKPQSAADAVVGRFSLDKKYHGELEATATGEMLTAMTATKGSAGYVAIEKVTGTLAGRSGTFHLQHTGTMNRGAPSLTITVVPDSGTGELIGLTGTMDIKIGADGAHIYVFDFAITSTP